MATVEQCQAALDSLAATLAAVEPQLRARHVPERTVACRLVDLDVTFTGRLAPDGLHDVVPSDDAEPAAEVRVSTTSAVLVALAAGEEDFLHAWLRGRVQVSASMRDLLRLRSIVGL